MSDGHQTDHAAQHWVVDGVVVSVVLEEQVVGLQRGSTFKKKEINGHHS